MPENNSPKTSEESGKVISGSVKKEKKPLKQRLVGFLFSNKLDSIGTYLLQYVIGPSLKDLIYKLGENALSMALYDNGGGPRGGQYIPNKGYQPGYDPHKYNTISTPNVAYSQSRPISPASRCNLEDYSFDSKDDAYRLLDRLSVDLGQYGHVSVADFYRYAGITPPEGNWAISNIGWYSLTEAHPIPCTDGRWIIHMPPIQQFR